MRIAAVQIHPKSGDIPGNILLHQTWVQQAIRRRADLVFFPELSITGYEPTLAKELRMTAYDARLEIFQQWSDEYQIIIGIGAPIMHEPGITISMILFHPHGPRQVYSKKYIHPDEEPYFIPGHNDSFVVNHHPEIALSICYELSIREHAENAHRLGAIFYLSSVAKTAQGIIRANASLAELAQKYKMTVLMANCMGTYDQVLTTGNSAIWNDQGVMVAQLDQSAEGMLVWDTKIQEFIP